MATSSLLIVGLGTWVSNRITQPFLGKYKGTPAPPLEKLLPLEKKGLKAAALALLIFGALLFWGILPENGVLRERGTGSVLHSPVLKGVVTIIFLVGMMSGCAFGFAAKTFKSLQDIAQAMQEAMVTMAPYLVLVFFASQFIAFFNASHMGLILAVHGAEVLKSTGLTSIPLMIGFILLTVVLDLFIGSASAKWALMAPIFVPMFMLLGYSPELTQAGYRIGDSVVNIISPLMSYFPMILAFANKYDSKAKVGTIMALMFPYSITFLVFWSIMLFVWMTLELPLGPGTSLWYRAIN